MLAEGDAAAGEVVFKKCGACHVAAEPTNKVGPTLNDLFGRQAGTLEGYRYSPGMVAYGESGVVWNEDTLMVYLEKPRELVKGTKMAFLGLPSEEDRADVIAYLKQFSQ